MMKRILFFLFTITLLCLSCQDDDSFTTSRNARLTFSSDTIKLDTVFSSVGSATYSFWVYNNNSDGVRISQAFLRKGNQTGYRVNVDGTFLDNARGSSVSDLELRKGDSLRVFVELTAPENLQSLVQLITDDIVFALESGVEQSVNLRGYAWDALSVKDLKVTNDSTIQSSKPIVVYGGITIGEGATLKILNTQLYFHDKAGINVYGTLKTDSVLMRGDRLDHMFAYLPYDRVSGQWEGIHLYGSSEGNELKNTELRSAMYGVICDSAKLSSQNQRLYMENSIVHNCKGNGLELYNTYAGIKKCQLSNMLGSCVLVYGGAVIMDSCTIAQFYPFSAQRNVALQIYNKFNNAPYPLEQFQMTNSILTGYANDEILGKQESEDAAFNYLFINTLLRTPQVENDTVHYKQILWEKPSDEISGKKHFVLVDETNFIYDFHLKEESPAKGLGCY